MTDHGEREAADVQAEDVDYSGVARLGKLIYRHRAPFLLPALLPALFLLNNPRILPLPWRLALYGAVLLGAGLRVYCTGYRTWAHKSSGTRHLMTAGIYAYVRHPLYVANFLIFMPVVALANVWWLSIAFAAWYVLTHWAIVVREEEALATRYGSEWDRYAAHVRRVVPRLRGYPDRRGAFSFEPVLRGREPLQTLGLAAVLVLFEIFHADIARWLDAVHAFLGLSLWN
jgi:protein-S-isoprenylcysteine O-methyltransferase Ste14